MDQEIIDRLSVITEEEKELLSGREGIDRSRYTEGKDLVIDSGHMLDHGQLTLTAEDARLYYRSQH